MTLENYIKSNNISKSLCNVDSASKANLFVKVANQLPDVNKMMSETQTQQSFTGEQGLNKTVTTVPQNTGIVPPKNIRRKETTPMGEVKPKTDWTSLWILGGAVAVIGVATLLSDTSKPETQKTESKNIEGLKGTKRTYRKKAQKKKVQKQGFPKKLK